MSHNNAFARLFLLKY